MQRVKNEHYVPQQSLKRFTEDGSTVYVFDKPTLRVFPSDVRNVASENGFYDLPPKFSKDPFAMDKALQLLERYAGPKFNQLLGQLEQHRGFNHRDHKLRQAIATFVVMQDVRTRLFRDQYVQQHHAIIKEIERRLGMRPPNVTEQVPPERIAFEHAKFMFSKVYRLQAVAALLNHIWLVGRNDTDQPLYFSDAPVTRFPHIGYPSNPFGGTGLTSKGVEIIFPLSSKYVLMMCERTFFAEKYAGLEGRMTALIREHVNFYNCLQISNSRRQIYCSQDKFDQVRRYAAEQPELFDVDRPRFKIL